MNRSKGWERDCEQTICRRGGMRTSFEPRGEWEGSPRKCQGFKPDLRNAEVRRCRGPRETRPWWNSDPASQTERARTVTLHLQGWRARALSQPRGNPEQPIDRTYGARRHSSTLPGLHPHPRGRDSVLGRRFDYGMECEHYRADVKTLRPHWAGRSRRAVEVLAEDPFDGAQNRVQFDEVHPHGETVFLATLLPTKINLANNIS
jgi:hypothetical protein